MKILLIFTNTIVLATMATLFFYSMDLNVGQIRGSLMFFTFYGAIIASVIGLLRNVKAKKIGFGEIAPTVLGIITASWFTCAIFS